MKRIFAAYILIMALLVGCDGGELTRSQLAKLQQSPLPPFTAPKVQVFDIDNGAKVFLMEDHTLPIVNIEVMIKAGSIYEKADHLGVSPLMAISMRNGGAGDLKPDKVDQIIEDSALRISFSSGREIFEASFKSLSPELDKSIKLFFDMLFRPRFDEHRFNIDRSRLIEQLKRDKDNPEIVATQDFRKLVYGDKSPWARIPEPDDVADIDREDIISFWKDFIRPNNILIAASGDFGAHDLVETITRSMEGASNDQISFPPAEEVKLEFRPAVKFVKKDLTQAFIYMGHLGIKRHNPDKYALQVMNTILGGGSFTSRLMQDIRSNRGLAYNVWSHFGWGTDYGLFQIYAATKAGQAKEVMELIREQIKTLADTGKVTAKEFSFAKEAELNRLIFEFDDSFKIATSSAYYHFYGYPPNYWEVYRDSVQKLKRSDIERVAREYIHPNGLKVLVVGPE